MARNEDLSKANKAKKDEFYTQYVDIESEINYYLEHNANVFQDKTILLPCDDPEWSNFTKYFIANFKRFGLKKLLSVSYAKGDANKFITDFERNSPNFDEEKHEICGKVFTFDRDCLSEGKVDFNKLTFSYLEGDGDFRSDEVKKLRDEADIIITNPPFSLFRKFLAWILEANKKFVIIGSVNAITYKEVFPLLRDNKIWLGESIHSGDREFGIPDDYPLEAATYRIDANGKKYIRVKGVRWFTNLDYKQRHEEMPLMTMAENLKFNKPLINDFKKQGIYTYTKYDNYDAIDIPISKAIPSDYEGVMGVPITFFDKYCPEQFEIIGNEYTLNIDKGRVYIDGERLYSRIFIKKKQVIKE